MLSAGQGSNRALSISMCFLVERVGTVCAGGSLKGVGDICAFLLLFFLSIFSFFLSIFYYYYFSQVVMGNSCMCKIKFWWIDRYDR